MKKQAKTSKNSNSSRKITKKTEKKTRLYKKRIKTNNAFRAFGLIAVMVAISIGISSAVIFIHSKSNELPAQAVKEDELTLNLNVEPEANTHSNISQSDKQTEPVRQPSEQRRNSIPSANTSAPVAGNIPVSPAKKQNVTNTSAPIASNTPVPSPQKQNVTRNIISQKPAENYGTLVFVIDDAGNNLRELEPFLRIPGPLTIAVLPGLPNSAEAAKRIRAAGKEVFLHQPMEAIGGQNPGPGAIYSGMNAAEIRAILKHNVEEIGPITGMNNHQGSKITMDRTAVETILAFCAENGLYFLDSRTTAETVVPSAARQLGIKIGERDTFIDNEQDKESMLRYITSGLEKARKNGSSVMIGHTWSPELAPILADQFPQFIEQGYTIKTASDIIKSK